MTASVPTVNVGSNATFQTLIDVINQTVNVLNTQALVPSLTSNLSVSTGNAHVFGWVGADHLYAPMELRGGNNSVANTLLVTSNVSVGNATVNLIITSTSVTIANTVVSATMVSAPTVATSNLSVGAVQANTTALTVGNVQVTSTGTVNALSMVAGPSVQNSSGFSTGNSTVNTYMSPLGALYVSANVQIGSVMSINTTAIDTGNVVIDPNSVMVGNSTSNLYINSTSLSIGGTTILGAGGALNSNNIVVGNTIVNTTQLTVGNTNVTASQISVAGGAAVINSTTMKVGSTVQNTSGFSVGNVTVNSTAVAISGTPLVTTATRMAVAMSNTLVGVEGRLNIIGGQGIILSVTDDPVNGQVTVAINANANAIAGNVTASSIAFAPNTAANLTSGDVQSAIVETANKAAKIGTVLPLTGGTVNGSITLAPSTGAGSLVVTGNGNAGVSLGRTDGSASNPMIDFHSGATATAYDVRIYASGGNGANNGGVLNFLGGGFSFNVRPTFNGATPYDTSNFSPSSYAPLASPAFTGTATFTNRPSFNGQTPYDTGNLTIANYAPLASPAFTGTATFAIRPTFNGATPWDSGNFTPSNYALASSLSSYALLSGANFGGTVSVGALVTMNAVAFSVGNTTSNSVQSQTTFTIANPAGSTQMSANGMTVGPVTVTSAGVYTGGPNINTTAISVGNVLINSTSITIGGVPVGSGSGNVSANSPIFQNSITINSPNTSVSKYTAYTVNGSVRWTMGTDTSAETGGNAGSVWTLNRYSDAGANTGTVMFFERTAGVGWFAVRPIFNGQTSWDAGNLPKATTAIATAGSDNTSFMTSSMTKAAIAQFAPTAAAASPVSGIVPNSVTSPFGNYVFSASNKGKMHIFNNSTASATLPAVSSSAGMYFWISNLPSFANYLVLQTNNQNTETFIDGQTQIRVYREQLMVYCDGSNWYPVARQRGWITVGTDSYSGASATSDSWDVSDPEINCYEFTFTNIQFSAGTDFRFLVGKNGGSLNASTTAYTSSRTYTSSNTISQAYNQTSASPSIAGSNTFGTHYLARVKINSTLSSYNAENNWSWEYFTEGLTSRGSCYEGTGNPMTLFGIQRVVSGQTLTGLDLTISGLRL